MMIWLLLAVVGITALTVIAFLVWFKFSFKIDLSDIDLTLKPEPTTAPQTGSKKYSSNLCVIEKRYSSWMMIRGVTMSIKLPESRLAETLWNNRLR